MLYFEKDCPKATLSDTRPGANCEIHWFDAAEGKAGGGVTGGIRSGGDNKNAWFSV